MTPNKENQLEHSEGQERARLFERLLFRLLETQLPDYQVYYGGFAGPGRSGEGASTIRADVVARGPAGELVVLEAKAPYRAQLRNQLLYGLRSFVLHLQAGARHHLIRRGIFAIAEPVAELLRSEFESLLMPSTMQLGQVMLELWDERHIRSLVEAHLFERMHDLSLAELRRIEPKVLNEARGTLSGSYVGALPPLEPTLGQTAPPIREHEAVVLFADFCSFSRFVAASRGDPALVTPLLRRLYQELHTSVLNAGGAPNRFLGDGFPSFWTLPSGGAQRDALARSIDDCVASMIGISENLANDWQEYINSDIEPKGLHCGAAMGTMTIFRAPVSGREEDHWVGEPINLAARLAAAAPPNCLWTPNDLYRNAFSAVGGFMPQPPRRFKGFGKLRFWEKAYRD